MEVGCSTLTFRHLPVSDALKHVASAGFGVVDLVGVPSLCPHVELTRPEQGQGRRLRGLLEELGLRVAALNTAPAGRDTFDDRDEFRRRYTRAADLARDVGAEVWIIDAGQPDPSRRAGIDRWKEAVRMGTQLARDRDLLFAVEAPHRGGLAGTLPETLDLLGRTEVKDLSLVCDTSHWFHTGATLAACSHALGERVAHVHLRDAVLGGHDTIPGEGEFGFEQLVANLRARGYEGSWILELEPSGDHTPEELVEQTIRARDQVHEILQHRAGVSRFS